MKLDTFALRAVVNRALYAASAGKHIKYKLGQGGFYPNDSLPTRNSQCDCSGFASWCINLNRSPKPPRPWWIETTNIYRNATNKDGLVDVFVQIPKAVPGCLVVYGDKNGSEGHIGVITEAVYDSKGKLVKLHGVDCSMGSQRKFGYAISKRDGTTSLGDMQFFLKNGGIFVVLKQHVLS